MHESPEENCNELGTAQCDRISPFETTKRMLTLHGDGKDGNAVERNLTDLYWDLNQTTDPTTRHCEGVGDSLIDAITLAALGATANLRKIADALPNSGIIRHDVTLELLRSDQLCSQQNGSNDVIAA